MAYPVMISCFASAASGTRSSDTNVMCGYLSLTLTGGW